jgi:hypothetical protein
MPAKAGGSGWRRYCRPARPRPYARKSAERQPVRLGEATFDASNVLAQTAKLRLRRSGMGHCDVFVNVLYLF